MTVRTALVTGGGGGIGAAICRGLADAGHRVAVADLAFENDAGRVRADQIKSAGVPALTDRSRLEDQIAREVG